MEETRGRPRNKAFEQIALAVAEWHQHNVCQDVEQTGSVSAGPFKEPAKVANGFRNSTAYAELQELYGYEVFSIRVNKKNSTFEVGYSEEGGA